MSESLSAPETGAVAPETGADTTDPFQPDPDAPEQTLTDQPEDDDFGDEKIKLKVNGKVVEKSLNDVIKAAQMYEASAIKLEQAKAQAEQLKTMQGQVQQQQAAIKSVLEVLARGDIQTMAEFAEQHLNAGQVFNQAVIQYALQLYEYSRMSEEQREAADNKKLLAKLQRDAEERGRQDQQRLHEYRVSQWMEHLNVEIPKALATVGLPNNDFVRQQIIGTWRAALEAGQTPTAAAVAAHVKEQLQAANIRLTQPMAPAPRQRATADSVARRANGATPPSPASEYMNFSDWQKSRGR
jgi:hypothetical protein